MGATANRVSGSDGRGVKPANLRGAKARFGVEATVLKSATFRLRGALRTCIVLGFVLSVAAAKADETDQYNLPLDLRMADIGDYLDAVHCRAVEAAVRKLNDGVRFARSLDGEADRAAALARLHDPGVVTATVNEAFRDVLSERILVGEGLTSTAIERAYPGKPVVHSADRWLYRGTHFWVDPRQFDMLIRAGTVRAYGVYFGVDKLVHFHQMGAEYYGAYRARMREGMGSKPAMQRVARTYASGNLFAETMFLGLFASSVYSNADLAANYAGMKFCINITEPVVLKGRERPPILVRSGDFWRVNTHVRPESGWFGVFVTDHWNEALNPNWWGWDIRGSMREKVLARARHIRGFYTTVDHRPDTRHYFDALAHELATFEGEDYGHSGNWDDLMTVGEIGWAVPGEKTDR